MDLKTARGLLNQRFERKAMGLTPEEVKRKERFDKLGERVQALHDSDKQGIKTHAEQEGIGLSRSDRINVSAIFVSNEHGEEDIILSLTTERSPNGPLAAIEAVWMEAGTTDSVTELLHVSDLYDFPEDAERTLERIEQSVTELETAPTESLFPFPDEYNTQ